jgi:hypothetical protein
MAQHPSAVGCLGPHVQFLQEHVEGYVFWCELLVNFLRERLPCRFLIKIISEVPLCIGRCSLCTFSPIGGASAETPESR